VTIMGRAQAPDFSRGECQMKADCSINVKADRAGFLTISTLLSDCETHGRKIRRIRASVAFMHSNEK